MFGRPGGEYAYRSSYKAKEPFDETSGNHRFPFASKFLRH